jgi:hypothetical protein
MSTTTYRASPTVDVGEARIVVLDLLERAAELEEALTSRILTDTRGWLFDGGTVPPIGHPYRSDFEAWAESAGCSGKRGYPAPRFPDKDGRQVGLWTVAKGQWTDGVLGRKWSGEPVAFEDWVSEDSERADRVANDLRTLVELRRFAADPPTGPALAEGWGPPSCIALEEHEAAILGGWADELEDDAPPLASVEEPSSGGLPPEVADWLRKLVHPPKQAYAADYCRARLYDEPMPADPGTPWAVKARKRADRIMENAS